MQKNQPAADVVSKGIGFLKRRPRDWKVTVARSSLARFINQMIFPYQSIYTMALGATATQLGLVNSVGMGVAGVLSPLVGWLIDRIGIKKIYLLGGLGLFKFNVFLGLSLPWIFFSLSNPQVTQRLFVPKSVAAFKQMIGGFLIFGFIYTVVSVLWGFSARLLIPGIEVADLATPSLLAHPIIPKVLAIIVMIGILSAAVSTIDSILLSLSSMFTRDFLKSGFSIKISEKSELMIGRFIILVLAVIFFIFAYWAAGKRGLAFMIAPLSSAASAGLLMAVPAIVGAFFWRRATAAGALCSMKVGAVLILALQITGCKPFGLWPAVWGLVLCIILYVVISLLTKAPVERTEKFIGYLEKDLMKHRFL